MCEQALGLNAGKRTDSSCKIRSGFICLKTNAAHAGIQSQMDLCCFFHIYRCLRQRLCLRHGKDSRTDLVLDQFLIAGRVGHSQDQDHLLNAVAAQQHGFVCGGHRKAIHIIFDGSSYRHRAMPVSICLDHSEHARLPVNIFAHGFQIKNNGIQIYRCINPHILHVLHTLVLFLVSVCFAVSGFFVLSV